MTSFSSKLLPFLFHFGGSRGSLSMGGMIRHVRFPLWNFFCLKKYKYIYTASDSGPVNNLEKITFYPSVIYHHQLFILPFLLGGPSPDRYLSAWISFLFLLDEIFFIFFNPTIIVAIPLFPSSYPYYLRTTTYTRSFWGGGVGPRRGGERWVGFLLY